MTTVRLGHPFSLLMSLLAIAAATPAKSQPITPANDGTGTTLTPQGNEFNIEGGTHSGANLFHSFEQFNVKSGQTANFVTTPDITNILGRVTGGNASYINGLIQIIGGNSNLFLINPTGIIFGPDASLNIPASFSVTTATGIGFDNNNFWFKAMGTNDYSNLVGDPSGYKFNVSNPGAIVNEGNLTLNPGENLTLLGGTVINSGQLSTAGGNITVAAVQGGSILRISKPENLLTLEVNSITVNGENTEITPLSLPGLLTGGEIIQATSVTVNENGDVVLTDSNTVGANVPGTAIASGGIDVSDSENVGGQVNILGDRVALIDTDINADGLNGGGTVLIGGESQENSTVFNSQETSINSGSIISANAIENGDGGNVIIRSDGTTHFGGNIRAKGGEISGNGGFVEVTGKQEFTFEGSVDVTAPLGEAGTILLQPESITIGEPENLDNSQTVENNTEVETTEADDSERTETEVETDIFAQDGNANVTISAENIGQLSGNVILEADNDITVNKKIETDSSVELKAGRSININADIDTSVGNGNIDLFGNNDEMNVANRNNGKASINQLDSTTLNAGSGRINIELGNLGEVGDINLASLTTTGEVFVNANEGNIARVSDSSIINAGSVLFQTSGTGGIGLTNAPLQLNVDSLEAVSGSGGVFFDVGNVNIGGVSEEVNGIVTAGGDIKIQSAGNVTLTESISTIETVENNFEAEISGGLGGLEAVEATENTEVTETSGAINIEATGDIVATGSGIKGGGESVSLSATNIRINDEFDETSGDADVKLRATNDITVEDIEDDVLEFFPGVGEIEFRADVDGDGVGVVQMLDNQADVGSDPNTFENGADTIKTNGRNLTIAGADIILGNIDTSWLPVFSGGELLTAIDVDEGGVIPPELEDKTGFIPFDSFDFLALERDSEGNFIIEGESYYIGNVEGQLYYIPTTTTVNDTATFTFTVDNDLGNVENLDVRFSVEHPFIFNLEVNLESPQGQEVKLFAGVGNSGQNFQDTVLDDDASRSIDSGFAPFNGTYRPQGSLANFNGENPNGTWTLRVTDTFPFFGDSTLYRAGDAASWGTVTGTQLLLRSPLIPVAGGRGSGNGGAINIDATHGDIRVENIRSLSETADGGRIDLKANNNIITDLINSSAVTGIGGDVNLNTISGNIDTFSLDTSSFDSNGGKISISTQTGNINTESLFSWSSGGNGGEISISTQTGDINTELLYSDSYEGNGGKISISTQTGDINTKSLYSRSLGGNGGEISISTQTGDINTKSLYSWSSGGNGGEISISTQTGDINTKSLYSSSSLGGNGGEITISTQTGDINTESLYSSSSGGNGGEITISTQTGDINTESLNSFSFNNDSASSENGGTITLIAETIKFNPPENGDGEQLAIRTFSVGTDGSGKGGDVNITTNNLTNAEILTLSSQGKSGEVKVESQPQGNLELNELSIITSKQVTVEIFGEPIQIIDVGAAEGQSGPVSIISNGNLNLNNVIIESDTKGEQPAGNVNIYSLGNITLDNTDILSTTSAQGNAGIITLETPQDIQLTNNSQLQASTQGRENAGNAGSINILANNLNLDEYTSLITETLSAGNPGSISIQAQTVDIGQGAQISATVVIGSTSDGDGGNITINTDQLNITGHLGIFAETEANANAGILTLSPYKENANLDITFSNDGFISASTSSTGNGGNIFISAPENIDISGEGFIAVETSGTGNAGIIDIQTENLRISDGVAISASTEDKGNAGQINIKTKNFTLETGTSLTTETNNQGQAGDIEINTRQLTIGENAQISATAREGATNTEAGGNITINANQLFISGRLGIFAETTGESPAGTLSINPYKRDGGMGRGGDGEIGRWGDGEMGEFEPNLNITFKEKGFISARTTSTGDGGNINIFAPENIDIIGEGKISVETTGSGEAGIINIKTENLTIAENTTISAASSNSGDGGSIIIGSINQMAEGNITNIQSADGKIILGGVNQRISEQFSDQVITILEENRSQEYSDYFGEDFKEKLVNTQNVRDILTDMANQTGKESAVVYINAYSDQIQIILFTKDGQPILKTIPTINREKLWKNAIMFSAEITDFRNRHTTSYLPLAQKLYDWLIAPISAELEAANIETILFSMDSGFRLLPLAALHDGEKFLIEKYSMSLIPSVSLMDSRYNSVKNTKLLGMGASKFIDETPLPAVPIELQTISEKLWRGNTFLNEEFTKNNLMNQLENRLYPIVHLATHAEFRAGKASDSYIHLWNDKLGLDEVRKLRWNSEKAELLVLSACRTAVGDSNAELGFAGLAIATGVKSALGSFWLVSDEGTLGLMTEFYSHLDDVKIKAEALREAQLRMLRGEVVIAEGTLRGSGSRGEVSLPPELGNVQNKNFAHPYYWAGFTMVGSPW
ncbi:CHAT domain-containing protein [Dapis sp. BLCC M126]|uniref:CHAT domain-containing protein n=1 Tax=Dapis sp. BLCC M126 TaxID=3400189 RepID=UPI003CF6D83F